MIAAARATWRPAAPLRLARRRASGQILAATSRMYFGHVGLFIGIGSILLPLAAVDAILQAVILRASSVAGIEGQGEGEGVLVLFVVALATALTLLGVAIVMAATIRALAELDGGRRVNPVRAYRLMLDSVRPMLGALFVAAVVVTLLATTIVLIPIAIALVIRWALIVPVTEIEDRSALGCARAQRPPGGASLAEGRLPHRAEPGHRPARRTRCSARCSSSPRPCPLSVANAVAGVVYALLMPFVAITTAYVYFDARVRRGAR